MRKKGHPIDIEVGARVRAFRLKAGLSQETVAKELDLTFQQIQKYEKGTNRISASRLVMFANVLKVPVAHFFGQDGKGEPVHVDLQLNTRTRHLLMNGLNQLGNARLEGILLDLINEMGRK